MLLEKEYLKKIIDVGKKESSNPEELSYFRSKLPDIYKLRSLLSPVTSSTINHLNRLMGKENVDTKNEDSLFIDFIKGCHIIETGIGGLGSTSFVTYQLIECLGDESLSREIYDWVAFNGGNYFIEKNVTYEESKKRAKDAEIRKAKILEDDQKVHLEAVVKKQHKRDLHTKKSHEINNYYKEFKDGFKKMNDGQLIDVFNKEVGNTGWVSARGSYLFALHTEFEDRGYNYSAIGNKKYLSLAKRVKLVGKKIVLDEEHN